MELDDVARRVDDVRAQLVHARLRLVAPRAHAMGADAAGSLGELGRALGSQADAAIAARIHETGALADAASGLATAVRSAAVAYHDAESRRTSGGL